MNKQSKLNSNEFLTSLIRHGLIRKEDARRALTASQEAGTSIEKTILEFGLIEENDLFYALAEHLELGFATAEAVDASLSKSLHLQPEFLRRVEVIAVEKADGGIALATSDPANLEALNSIGFHLNMPVTAMIAAPSTVKTVLASLTGEAKNKGTSIASTTDIDRLKALANEGPVIKLVNDIIAKAVEAGASDIHIEADETGARVRYRIDGVLQTEQPIAEHDKASVVSRLKVMANLNISERRRPQDGRAQISVRGRAVDIRLSTLPTQFGESIVLRLLDRSRLKLDWNELGFPVDRAREIEQIVNAPNGIFLVAGPTGSGKTTTLYTALSRINSEDRKIVSVEDPIEFSLDGVNQVQVDPQIDMTFARALRSILRQDPDIIMVGEIRDQETAEIAVRAALVGRMVLSTIHTNDSISAITRLSDLGVPAYLLAATLRGVLSQRLVRRICQDCRGAGCDNCDNSGQRGRIVVSELLKITPAMAQSISDGDSVNQLEQLARHNGFQPLFENGRALIDSGEASSEEVLRTLG
jgi:general secretion pathway protein E